jgi:hypothetical protein
MVGEEARECWNLPDVAPDGKRVAALMPAEGQEGQEEQKAQNHVIFLENFFDESPPPRACATQVKETGRHSVSCLLTSVFLFSYREISSSARLLVFGP